MKNGMASLIRIKNGGWRVQIESRGQREYKTIRLKSLADAWATQREAEIQRPGKCRPGKFF